MFSNLEFVTGATATNIQYDSVLDETYFEVSVDRINNPFDITGSLRKKFPNNKIVNLGSPGSGPPDQLTLLKTLFLNYEFKNFQKVIEILVRKGFTNFGILNFNDYYFNDLKNDLKLILDGIATTPVNLIVPSIEKLYLICGLLIEALITGTPFAASSNAEVNPGI